MAKRVIKSALDETPDDIIYNALTDEEQEVCRNVMVFGPDWLRSNRKWSAEKIKRFINRAEVKREMDMLKRQYEDREGIQERTQYLSQLKVNGMVPAAVNILARALRGEYVSGDGKRVPPPTPQQFAAAQEVLSRANIQGGKYGGNDSVPAIDARSVQIAIGTAVDSDLLDPKGRQRVMDVLNMVANKSRALATSERLRDVTDDDT